MLFLFAEVARDSKSGSPSYNEQLDYREHKQHHSQYGNDYSSPFKEFEHSGIRGTDIFRIYLLGVIRINKNGIILSDSKLVLIRAAI